MLTIFGVAAVGITMLMYVLERRSRWFVLGFAGGCVLSSIYGFLAGTWPFGVVEVVWTLVALRRYMGDGVADLSAGRDELARQNTEP